MVFLVGCYIDPNTGSSSDNSFASNLAPLLSSSCATSGCHDATSSVAGLDLEINDTRLAGDVFDAIQAAGFIDIAAPEASVLLTQAANSDQADPHGGGEVFAVDSSEYNDLLAWITDGALNDDCTNVVHGFATDVSPVFSNCNAAGCHNADQSLNLLPADAFASIVANGAVDSNDPIGSGLLQYALGNEPHPAGAVFASPNDDDFRTIFCWIKVDQAIEN